MTKPSRLQPSWLPLRSRWRSFVRTDVINLRELQNAVRVVPTRPCRTEVGLEKPDLTPSGKGRRDSSAS